MKSTRLAFVFVTFVTLVLLLGSVFLQRIVFKAAESQSSFYVTPTSFSVQPSGTVELTLRSNFSIPAFIVAGQVAVTYDETQLEYVGITPASDFTTSKTVNEAGETLWAFIPAPSHGLVAQLRGDISVGLISFKALVESATTIAIDPSRTIISAIDPEGATALYNAVVSTQGSVGQISSGASSDAVTAPEIVEQPREKLGTIQQISRVEVVPYPTEAVVLAQLRYLGQVEVRFGVSANNLSQKVVGSTSDANQAIRLSGLLPGEQYFFRVSTLTVTGDTSTASQIKTFTTPLASAQPASAETSQLLAVAPVTSRESDVYGKLRTVDGGAADTNSVIFRIVTGEATITAADDTLPRVRVQTLSSQKQKVVVEAVAGEVVIARTSLLFDPTVEQLAEPDQTINQTLPFTRSVQLIVLAVLVILLTTGLVLVRLLRVH